jgi:hypothetical protein
MPDEEEIKKGDGGSSSGGNELDFNLTGQLWGWPISLAGQTTITSNISSIPANLTIVNQTNQTTALIIATIGVLGAISGALASGLAAYYIEKLKIDDTKRQRMQQAYYQLYGRKCLYLQNYASYFMNFILLEYSYALRDYGERFSETIKIKGKEYRTKNTEIDPQKVEYFVKRSDELSMILAQSKNEVWEIIGQIKLLFTDTDEEISKIKDFAEKFGIFEEELIKEQENGSIEFEFSVLPRDKLSITSDWPSAKKEMLKDDYINKYDELFDALLANLQNEIEKEKKNTTKLHCWQLIIEKIKRSI